MGSFNPKASNLIIFNNTVYTYDKTDRVLGGLTGVSNAPILDLSANSAYLKKFKGTILRGTEDPNTSSTVSTYLDGVTFDEFFPNRILYFKTDDGSLWTVDETSYDETAASVLWVNNYTTVSLNVKALKLNGDGDDSTYIYFEYDNLTKTLSLKDETDALANIQVDELKFNVYDGEEDDITKIADNEILLMYHIEDDTENDDAFFAVKRLEPLTTSVTISAFEMESGVDEDTWTTTAGNAADLVNNDYVQVSGLVEGEGENINGYYRVKSYDGTSLVTDRNFKAIVADEDESGLSGELYKDNAAMIKWNETSEIFELVTRDGDLLGLSVESLQINGVDAGFYSFFINTVISNQVEFDAFFDDTDLDIEGEWVYVKSGDYEMSNDITVISDNCKIEFADGCNIDLKGYSFDISGTENVSVIGGTYTNTGGSVSNVFDISDCTFCRLENMIFSDITGDTCITGSSDTGGSTENCGLYRIRIEEGNDFDININDVQNSCLIDCYLYNTESGNLNYSGLNNCVFIGFLDGESNVFTIGD